MSGSLVGDKARGVIPAVTTGTAASNASSPEEQNPKITSKVLLTSSTADFQSSAVQEGTGMGSPGSEAAAPTSGIPTSSHHQPQKQKASGVSDSVECDRKGKLREIRLWVDSILDPDPDQATTAASGRPKPTSTARASYTGDVPAMMPIIFSPTVRQTSLRRLSDSHSPPPPALSSALEPPFATSGAGKPFATARQSRRSTGADFDSILTSGTSAISFPAGVPPSAPSPSTPASAVLPPRLSPRTQPQPPQHTQQRQPQRRPSDARLNSFSSDSSTSSISSSSFSHVTRPAPPHASLAATPGLRVVPQKPCDLTATAVSHAAAGVSGPAAAAHSTALPTGSTSNAQTSTPSVSSSAAALAVAPGTSIDPRRGTSVPVSISDEAAGGAEGMGTRVAEHAPLLSVYVATMPSAGVAPPNEHIRLASKWQRKGSDGVWSLHQLPAYQPPGLQLQLPSPTLPTQPQPQSQPPSESRPNQQQGPGLSAQEHLPSAVPQRRPAPPQHQQQQLQTAAPPQPQGPAQQHPQRSPQPQTPGQPGCSTQKSDPDRRRGSDEFQRLPQVPFHATILDTAAGTATGVLRTTAPSTVAAGPCGGGKSTVGAVGGPAQGFLPREPLLPNPGRHPTPANDAAASTTASMTAQSSIPTLASTTSDHHSGNSGNGRSQNSWYDPLSDGAASAATAVGAGGSLSGSSSTGGGSIAAAAAAAAAEAEGLFRLPRLPLPPPPPPPHIRALRASADGDYGSYGARPRQAGHSFFTDSQDEFDSWLIQSPSPGAAGAGGSTATTAGGKSGLPVRVTGGCRRGSVPNPLFGWDVAAASAAADLPESLLQWRGSSSSVLSSLGSRASSDGRSPCIGGASSVSAQLGLEISVGGPRMCQTPPSPFGAPAGPVSAPAVAVSSASSSSAAAAAGAGGSGAVASTAALVNEVRALHRETAELCARAIGMAEAAASDFERRVFGSQTPSTPSGAGMLPLLGPHASAPVTHTWGQGPAAAAAAAAAGRPPVRVVAGASFQQPPSPRGTVAESGSPMTSPAAAAPATTSVRTSAAAAASASTASSLPLAISSPTPRRSERQPQAQPSSGSSSSTAAAVGVSATPAAMPAAVRAGAPAAAAPPAAPSAAGAAPTIRPHPPCIASVAASREDPHVLPQHLTARAQPPSQASPRGPQPPPPLQQHPQHPQPQPQPQPQQQQPLASDGSQGSRRVSDTPARVSRGSVGTGGAGGGVSDGGGGAGVGGGGGGGGGILEAMAPRRRQPAPPQAPPPQTAVATTRSNALRPAATAPADGP